METHQDAAGMAWYFRVIEQLDGRWACRHGHQIFDAHSELHDALDHIRALAATALPAELFVHYLDGTVDFRGSV
jgi:hypothetical protein